MDFSLERCEVQLNGHTVTGWSDDAEALSIPEIDLATIVRGAGGGMVSTSNGEKGGPVILKLLPNSPSVPFFMNLITAQMNGASIVWNGLFRDPVNKVTVAFMKGVLQHGPLGQTIGKGSTKNIEITIEFEKVIPDYSAVNFS